MRGVLGCLFFFATEFLQEMVVVMMTGACLLTSAGLSSGILVYRATLLFTNTWQGHAHVHSKAKRTGQVGGTEQPGNLIFSTPSSIVSSSFGFLLCSRPCLVADGPVYYTPPNLLDSA